MTAVLVLCKIAVGLMMSACAVILANRVVLGCVESRERFFKCAPRFSVLLLLPPSHGIPAPICRLSFSLSAS